VPYDDLEAMEGAVDEETAAIIVEVVQGESGVRPGSADYFAGLQVLCRERDVLLIVDEVQTGFGRTGRMFACEHYGVVPDILCMAKSIAGGVPMGAISIGPRVQGAIKPMSHGSTFGGNPLACAAALAAIRYLEDYGLVELAAELGHYMRARLEAIDARVVREVRGLGLMIGMELRQRVTPYLRALMERGVLALPAGRTVLRLLPPLVIEREELDRVAEAIGEVLRS
jgi:acetylornithine/LysW-gamma-L-lysine aminotransferase